MVPTDTRPVAIPAGRPTPGPIPVPVSGGALIGGATATAAVTTGTVAEAVTTAGEVTIDVALVSDESAVGPPSSGGASGGGGMPGARVYLGAPDSGVGDSVAGTVARPTDRAAAVVAASVSGSTGLVEVPAAPDVACVSVIN